MRIIVHDLIKRMRNIFFLAVLLGTGISWCLHFFLSDFGVYQTATITKIAHEKKHRLMLLERKITLLERKKLFWEEHRDDEIKLIARNELQLDVSENFKFL